MPTLDLSCTFQGFPVQAGFSLTRSRGVGPDRGWVILPVRDIESLQEKGTLILDDGERYLEFNDLWIDTQGTEVVDFDGDGNPITLRVNFRDERWILQAYGPDDDDAVRDINILLNPELDIPAGSDPKKITTGITSLVYRTDTLDGDTPHTLVNLVADLLSPIGAEVSYEGSKSLGDITDIRWRWSTYDHNLQELLEQSGDLHLILTHDGKYQIWPDGEGEEPDIPQEYTSIQLGDRVALPPEVVWVVGAPIQVDEQINNWIPVGELEQDYVLAGETYKKGNHVPLLKKHEEVPGVSIESFWDWRELSTLIEQQASQATKAAAQSALGVAGALLGVGVHETPLGQQIPAIFIDKRVTAEQQMLNNAALQSSSGGTWGLSNANIVAPGDIKERAKVAKLFYRRFRLPAATIEPNWRKLPMLPVRCGLIADAAKRTDSDLPTDAPPNVVAAKKAEQSAIINKLKQEKSNIEVKCTMLQPNQFRYQTHVPRLQRIINAPPIDKPTVKDHETGIIEFPKAIFNADLNTGSLRNEVTTDLTIGELAAEALLRSPEVNVRYSYERQQIGRSDYYAYYQRADGSNGNAHIDFFKQQNNQDAGNQEPPVAPNGRSRIIKDSTYVLCQIVDEDGNVSDLNRDALNARAEKVVTAIFNTPLVVENKKVTAQGFHEVNCNGAITTVRWSSDGDTGQTDYQINDPIPIDGGMTEAEKIGFIDGSIAPPHIETVSNKPASTSGSGGSGEPTEPMPLFGFTRDPERLRLTEIAVITDQEYNTGIQKIAEDEDGLVKGCMDFNRDWVAQRIENRITPGTNSIVFRPANVVFEAVIEDRNENALIVTRRSHVFAHGSRKDVKYNGVLYHDADEVLQIDISNEVDKEQFKPGENVIVARTGRHTGLYLRNGPPTTTNEAGAGSDTVIKIGRIGAGQGGQNVQQENQNGVDPTPDANGTVGDDLRGPNPSPENWQLGDDSPSVVGNFTDSGSEAGTPIIAKRAFASNIAVGQAEDVLTLGRGDMYETGLLPSPGEFHASFNRAAHVHEHENYPDIEVIEGPSLGHLIYDTGKPVQSDSDTSVSFPPENSGLRLREDFEFERDGTGGRMAIENRPAREFRRKEPYSPASQLSGGLSSAVDPPFVKLGWLEWDYENHMQDPVAPEGLSVSSTDEIFQNKMGGDIPVLRPAIILSVEAPPGEPKDKTGGGTDGGVSTNSNPPVPCDKGFSDDGSSERPKREESPESDAEAWKAQQRKIDENPHMLVCPKEFFDKHTAPRNAGDYPPWMTDPRGEHYANEYFNLDQETRAPFGALALDLLDRPVGSTLTLQDYGRKFAYPHPRAADGTITWDTIGPGTDGWAFNMSPQVLDEVVSILWQKVGYHAHMVDAFFTGNNYDVYGGNIGAMITNIHDKDKEVWGSHVLGAMHWNFGMATNYPVLDVVSDFRLTTDKDTALTNAGEFVDLNNPILRINRKSGGARMRDYRPGIRFVNNNATNINTESFYDIESASGEVCFGDHICLPTEKEMRFGDTSGGDFTLYQLSTDLLLRPKGISFPAFVMRADPTNQTCAIEIYSDKNVATDPPKLSFIKTIKGAGVTDNYELGAVEAYGWEPVAGGHWLGASIEFRVDGVTAFKHVPTEIVFKVDDGATAMIIHTNGVVDITQTCRAKAFIADGDPGSGLASTVTLTNATLASNSVMDAIKAPSGYQTTMTGWITAYVGTTKVAIPYVAES